jgi:acetyl-CoA synthetase
MSNYIINSESDYQKSYKASVENPEEFWGSIASENFVWRKKWDSVLEGTLQDTNVKWFNNAELNITENCIDRHLAENGDKTAIIWEPNNPAEAAQHISYTELHQKVNKMANVLKSKGVKKGDRVCLYLPMIPELAISVLACARIGAIHSVVFAGFSSTALASRINDSDCKLVITSDGSFRGAKRIDLKSIVDEAVLKCPCVDTVLVVNRLNSECKMREHRDFWLTNLLEEASAECEAETMKAEDPLFILYTSGSTGQPKGMVHTTAGYMVYTAYTFKNVFKYQPNDVYWCTADIGWITGHSYIVYGPLLNGATTVMFEGTPSYPDCSRFWQVVEKHKVNQFYTAPTAIRALAKEGEELISNCDLSSLKVIGSVGEPINEEAWHWYDDNIGKNKCPIVDTWWQTETGGIMISPLPNTRKIIPTFATQPLPGVQLALVEGMESEFNEHAIEGKLCIKFPWPSMARTIWGNHQRYIDTYFSTVKGMYFTGDGAMKDDRGRYRITGRIDDVVIVSGHNLGTAPIEDVIDEHKIVVETAIVGYPHDIKGNGLYAYVILKQFDGDYDELRKEINLLISKHIGPIAKLDKIQFVNGLPKTRSGKIMRRILRKIAGGEIHELGDISTLLNPEVVAEVIEGRL